MGMDKPVVATIDDYINQCDESQQERLRELRAFIRQYAPEASEKISYGMPTFYLNGNLIHFALAKHHIGLYPAPSGIERFAKQFVSLGLKYSKGAVQLPLTQEMPWELIKEIVVFRVAENKKKQVRR